MSLQAGNSSSAMKKMTKKPALGLYGAIFPTVSDDKSDSESLEGSLEAFTGTNADEDPLLESFPLLQSFRNSFLLASPMGASKSNFGAIPESIESQSFDDDVSGPSQIGTASIRSEVMTIAKNLLGAGVLSLSEGIALFSNDSFAMIIAIAWIVSLGGIFAYFCLLIAKICQKTGSSTYRECWTNTMGDRGGLVVSVMNILLPAQGNLSATTVLSQTLQSLLETFSIQWSRLTCLFVLTVVILLPLCLMRDLDSISPFSTIGVVSMAVSTIALMIRYFDDSYEPGGSYFDDISSDLQPSFGNETAWNATMLPFACMIFNSYIMHYNAPRLYMELKDRSIPRFTMAVGWSFGLTSIIFILIAGTGYLTFGENSSPYILNNYSPDDPIATASRICIFFSTLLMYPIAFFGVRDGLLDLLGMPAYTQTTLCLNTVSILALSLLTILAILFHDLGLINAVGGGALATFLCIIFPALMYRQLVAKAVEPNGAEIAESWLALILMIVGIVLGTSGVYQSLV